MMVQLAMMFFNILFFASIILPFKVAICQAMWMSSVVHGHQEMHSEHDYYEREQLKIVFYAQNRGEKD